MRVRDVTDRLSFVDKIHRTALGPCPTLLVEEIFPTRARQVAARLGDRVGIQFITAGALVQPRHHGLRGRIAYLLLPTDTVETGDATPGSALASNDEPATGPRMQRMPHKSIRLAQAWRLSEPPKLWGELLNDPDEADQYVALVNSAGQVLLQHEPTAALELLFERIADHQVEPALLSLPVGNGTSRRTVIQGPGSGSGSGLGPRPVRSAPATGDSKPERHRTGSH